MNLGCPDRRNAYSTQSVSSKIALEEPGSVRRQKNQSKMSFTILTGPPGPEARALAEKELRETEENVKNGIKTLRKYIEG